MHGHHIYRIFDTAVMLEQVIRQHGTDPVAQSFRDLLMRLRNGETTQKEWELLLERAPYILFCCKKMHSIRLKKFLTGQPKPTEYEEIFKTGSTQNIREQSLQVSTICRLLSDCLGCCS